jgi:hypothetical protein
MMKKTAYLLSALLLISIFAVSQPTKEDLRTGFFSMHDIKCGQLKFFEVIQSEKYDSPVHQSYAGTAEAASAECVSGPRSKLRYFSRGKANLEEAVKLQPDNPEIRFMRFATQANIPSFLFYDNIGDDVALIIKHLPDLLKDKNDSAFWAKATGFMIDTGKLKKEDQEILERLINR